MTDILLLVLLLELVFVAGFYCGSTVSHRRAMRVLKGVRNV
jgi:hypothetical protein